MDFFKAVYHPGLDRLEVGDRWDCHALLIGHRKDFDFWVRATIFPRLKRVYFRGYRPHFKADYDEPWTEEALDIAYEACDKAYNALLTKKLIKKSWKALYWHTDNVVTSELIKV